MSVPTGLPQRTPYATVPVADPRGDADGDEPVRVMLCDDSIAMRNALAGIIEADPMLRVTARAGDGEQALAEITRQASCSRPIDVIVLDLEMPVMDGMTALPLLLRADPQLRVVVASTLTTRGADAALRALRHGAADYLAKPSGTDGAGGRDVFARELVAKIHGQARLRRRRAGLRLPRQASSLRAASLRPPMLVAIGSSTGGPQALLTLAQGLPQTLPVPIVLTQHMPATFIPILAEHITRAGGPPCAEARDGDPLQPGRILLAPGGHHLLVSAEGGALRARLSSEGPINFCRPSVDPMLTSAASACGGQVLTIMLTGMGQDGLAGTRAVISAGGTAIAQDEATSVVWGMPGSVAQAGLCHAVLPLAQIADKIVALIGHRPGRVPLHGGPGPHPNRFATQP